MLAVLRLHFFVILSAGLLLALTVIPASAQTVDSDGDGLFDEDEIALGTDPARYDTDGDGFGDNLEVVSGTDPLDPNSVPPGEPGATLDDDGDLLSNGEEQNLGTDPNDADTDDDGISDFGELGFEPGSGTGTDPLVFDTDGDGVGDGAEVTAGSDPTDPASVLVAALSSTGTGTGLGDEHDGFLAAALAAALAAGLLGVRNFARQRRP